MAVAALTATYAPSSSAQPGAGDEAADAATAFGEGLALDRQGRFAQACARYELAVRLTPAWGLARYELAQCLRLQGDPDDRAMAHVLAAERDLQRPPIYVEMARIAEDHGDVAAARTAYERALALEAAEVRAQAGLARLQTVKDRDAIAQLEAYLTRYPGDVAAWRRLAEIAEARRKYPLAEEALRKVVALSAHKRAAVAALGAFGERTRRKALVEEARRLMPRGR